MMSSNRESYGSASEWLAVLRQDEAWLSQLQRLQASADSTISFHPDDMMRLIGNGETFAFWEIYQHKVEPVVAEVWEIAELSLPKLKIQTIGMLSMEWLEQHRRCVHNVPDKLKTQKAMDLLEDLVDGGILKENWQPNGLSGSERALVARAISDRLGIKEVWQLFGQMWNEKSETLRSYLNKAFDQKKSLEFQEKLKEVLS